MTEQLGEAPIIDEPVTGRVQSDVLAELPRVVDGIHGMYAISEAGLTVTPNHRAEIAKSLMDDFAVSAGVAHLAISKANQNYLAQRSANGEA